MKTELTAARLRELLHYDPETGFFTWIAPTTRSVRPGDRAGCLDSGGYRIVTIDSRRRLAHRIAWLYVHGAFPSRQVDHCDGARDNNSIRNLRLASNAENSQNRCVRSDSSTGMPGVGWHKRSGKYQARITVNGHRRALGFFATSAEANDAYLKAKARLHWFQPEHRSAATSKPTSDVFLALVA